MFGLLKTEKEKAFGLKDFMKWAKASDRSMGNPHKFLQTERQTLLEYTKLITPEQKIYAAYTSFSPTLKDAVKDDLEIINEERKQEALNNVFSALEEKGKHGCSHLLKNDYKDFF